ncbi:MAG: hypothetical protein IIX61_07215 [Loktanella sp.]|nr:hypothetical protein [Loktanella sp.]
MGNEIITTAQMYWLTRLTPLGHGVGFIIFILAALALGLLILGLALQDPFEVNDDGHRFGRKMIKASPFVAVLAVILLIANCLLPTTKEMAAILIIPRVANSEKVQTVGNHLYDLACEWMEELRPAKGKEGGAK